MRRGRACDTTAETAAGNALGHAVLDSVLSRIEDANERAVLLAHLALDLPVPAVARALALEPRAVEETVKSLLARLRSDRVLTAQLGEIRHAGKAERYLAIAEQLNLQDWLCARCGRPMVQQRAGRTRKTCSDSCRVALSLANGQGWKETNDLPAGATQRTSRASGNKVIWRPTSLVLTTQENQAIRALLREILEWNPHRSRTIDYRNRNKAILLTGFSCPVQLSPRDLANLNLNDVSFTVKGLEIRLTWNGNKAPGRRYVTVPSDEDPDLCPVRAMHAWKDAMSRAGRRSGSLFPRMAYWEGLNDRRLGMGGRVMAFEILNAIYGGHLDGRPLRILSESDPVPGFLREIISGKANADRPVDKSYLGRS